MTDHIVIPATTDSWRAASCAANRLARLGHAPQWTSAAFHATGPAQERLSFAAGAIVVTAGAEGAPGVSGAAGADDIRARLRRIAGPCAVPVTGLSEAGTTPIRSIRVAVYGSGGAPYNHAAVFAAAGFLTEFVFAQDILSGALADFDLLAVPGGGGKAMLGQLDPLGEAGCRAIRDFVAAGGMYLGSCAGAFDASLVSESFVAACPQQRQIQMINAEVWNGGSDWMGLQSPGVGVIHGAIAAPHHPVTRGLPAKLEITHYNGPLYRLDPGRIAQAGDAVGLTRVTGTGKDFTAAEHFLGGPAAAGDCLISRAVSAGAFNAVAGSFGKGRVVLFGSHPEFGLGLDLGAWDHPAARLIANAALWQASTAGPARADRSPPRMAAIRFDADGDAFDALHERIGAVVAAAEALTGRDASAAGWLDAAQAMSTFGRSGAAIWNHNLAAFPVVAGRLRDLIAHLRRTAGQAAGRAGADDNGTGAALDGLEQAIRYATPADWNNDFGYEGALQQLDRAERMLRDAGARFDRALPPAKDAYDHLDDSPYHLAVGSYLSAAGVFGNVLLLLQMQSDRLDGAMHCAFGDQKPTARAT